MIKCKLCFLLLLFCLICCCCCCRKGNKKQKRKNASYDPLPRNDIEEALEIDSFKGSPSSKHFDNDNPVTYYMAPARHKAVDQVANYTESGAETSVSDIEGTDSVSISAYGDVMSTFSGSSIRSNFSRNPNNLAIQTSLIYSRDGKYVAGKIVLIDGLGSGEFERQHLIELKCHVVVIPMKKYALKTNWYSIKKNRVKMDEYFKFKFKSLPSEGKTMLRFRLYGRRVSIGRSYCLGECYVNLREIVTSRGGLTIWRPITQGGPETIVED